MINGVSGVGPRGIPPRRSAGPKPPKGFSEIRGTGVYGRKMKQLPDKTFLYEGWSAKEITPKTENALKKMGWEIDKSTVKQTDQGNTFKLKFNPFEEF